MKQFGEEAGPKLTWIGGQDQFESPMVDPKAVYTPVSYTHLDVYKRQTTPWTLPSNVALCVNPDETYAKVKAADGYTYYMAQALLDTVLGKLADKEAGTPAYEVLDTFPGKTLEYKEYEPLFKCAVPYAEKQHKKAFFVACDSYVTLTDGTGVVHQAPAFGEDDARVGRKYDMPFVQLVDGSGHMTEDTPFAGLFVKDADPEVLKDLDKRGLLFDAPKFEHSYPCLLYTSRCV